MVDQSPIVRAHPVPTPAVYSGVFGKSAPCLRIRKRPAPADEAGILSFNSGDGRCPRCMGMGSEKVEMQFLSDIFVQCPLCHGARYGTRY